MSSHSFGLKDNYSGVDDVSGAIDDALMSVYVNHPGLVVASEKDLKKIGSLHEEITAPIRHKVDYSRQESTAPEENFDAPVEIVIENLTFGLLAVIIIFSSCKTMFRVTGIKAVKVIILWWPVPRYRLIIIISRR